MSQHPNYRLTQRPAAAQYVIPIDRRELVELFYLTADTVVNPLFKKPCLRWPLSLDSRGYGAFHLVTEDDGRDIKIRAHVISYRVARLDGGPIPNGLQVNHVCGFKPCFEPEHLYLGTHLMNMSDYRRRGSYAEQQRRINRVWRTR